MNAMRTKRLTKCCGSLSRCSDASVFAKMTHTSSRCWGVIWGLVAVASLAAAIYFNLLVGEDEGEPLTSFGDASTETKVVLGVAVGVVGLSVVHTALTRRCKLLAAEMAWIRAHVAPCALSSAGMIRKREGFAGYFSSA